MLIGRQKGNFRIRVLNLVNKKSKTITLHVTDSKVNETTIVKKIIEALKNKE